MSDIHIKHTVSDELPRIKPLPRNSELPVPFSYFPSDDGTDENLLILLHGLGDTHTPFARMARQLKLPQTAVLALRAPERIPYLYEDAFQWYTSFDPLGELIETPNPTPAIELMKKVIDHLINKCGWPLHRIHLFGFAQGGSVAAEFGLAWWKEHLLSQSRGGGTSTPSMSQPSATITSQNSALGSVVSISGPLISYPSAISTKCPTPVLVVHDSPPAETALPLGAIAAYRKAYENVTEQKSSNVGMPKSKEGWQPVMQFWSTHLGRRQISGLYEVMSGMITGSPTSSPCLLGERDLI